MHQRYCATHTQAEEKQRSEQLARELERQVQEEKRFVHASVIACLTPPCSQLTIELNVKY